MSLILESSSSGWSLPLTVLFLPFSCAPLQTQKIFLFNGKVPSFTSDTISGELQQHPGHASCRHNITDKPVFEREAESSVVSLCRSSRRQDQGALGEQLKASLAKPLVFYKMVCIWKCSGPCKPPFGGLDTSERLPVLHQSVPQGWIPEIPQMSVPLISCPMLLCPREHPDCPKYFWILTTQIQAVWDIFNY